MKLNICLIIIFFTQPLFAEQYVTDAQKRKYFRPMGKNWHSKSVSRKTYDSFLRISSNTYQHSKIGISNFFKNANYSAFQFRNFLARLQGVDVVKIKKEIKSQVKLCHQNRKELARENLYLKSAIKSARLNNGLKSNIAAEKKFLFSKKKLEGLDFYNENIGALVTTSTAISQLPLGGGAGAMVSSVGLYASVGAVLMLGMMDSVKKEIKRETDKFSKCSEKYNKSYQAFHKNLNTYIMKTETDEQKAKLRVEINDLSFKMTDLYFKVQFKEKTNLDTDFFRTKEALLLKIKDYLYIYPDQHLYRQLKHDVESIQVSVY